MHPRMFQLFRSPMALRSPENDAGHDPKVADPAFGADDGDDGGDKPKEAPAKESEPKGEKPSDEEARLLREVMKQKNAAREAKEALNAANAALAKYDGIDVDKVRELLATQAEAERVEAEKRGEYDRIVASMKEQHQAALSAIEAEKQTVAERLAAAQRQIDELTIGASFANSKFLAEETVLTANKARKLYDDHFEIENGALVAYDKPRGVANRTPLVDANGEKIGFEAAIEKIVRADPDFESIGKSKLKQGSGSAPVDVKSKEEKPIARGVNRISTALNLRSRA